MSSNNRNEVNPDLAIEREQSTLNVENLKKFIGKCSTDSLEKYELLKKLS